MSTILTESTSPRSGHVRSVGIKQVLMYSHFLQFYRCFLALFHCDHWSVENGNTSMPSKTTVIQLNRRVYSNTVACTAQLSTETLNPCSSTPHMKHTNPPGATS